MHLDEDCEKNTHDTSDIMRLDMNKLKNARKWARHKEIRTDQMKRDDAHSSYLARIG
jgi:hypothetical protein